MDEDKRRENLQAILEKAARASLGDHSWSVWQCPCGQKNRVDRVRVGAERWPGAGTAGGRYRGDYGSTYPA